MTRPPPPVSSLSPAPLYVCWAVLAAASVGWVLLVCWLGWWVVSASALACVVWAGAGWVLGGRW